MYIKRLLAATLKTAVQQFPAVLVTGPRQAGKTTFLLHEAGKKADYVSFDDPMERQFAVTDPNGFLDRFTKRQVILDEIQYVPEILPYLKIRIDRRRPETGKWILTGSQQFQLMKNISESLAGRIAIIELLPFSLREYPGGKRHSLENAVWTGGYPEPALDPSKRDLWISSYIQTYIERDVRQIQNIKDLRMFESFIGLTAAHHSQEFNTAVLSRKAGVTLPTIKSWAGVLDASYLCYFLPPYFRNYGKRLIRTPKLYYLDPALVCALTRIPDGKSAVSGPMGGPLLEGLIVSEALKVFAMKGKRPELYFWRSHDGLEVDLLVGLRGKLHPVEIKLTSTPTEKHLEPLNRFRGIAGKHSSETGMLVCRVDRMTPMPNNNRAVPWHEFPEMLASMI